MPRRFARACCDKRRSLRRRRTVRPICNRAIFMYLPLLQTCHFTEFTKLSARLCRRLQHSFHCRIFTLDEIAEITMLKPTYLLRGHDMQGNKTGDIRRDYGRAEVERLAGSFRVRHTVAEMGAARLRHLLATEPFVPTLGALTGNQAVQQVKAGLKA